MAAICTLAALALSETDNTAVTLIARFIAGLATAGLYAIGDAWINDTASRLYRGRILAIYSIILGVASVLSQIVVVLYSEDLAGSFVIVAALYCLAIIVLAAARTDSPKQASSASVQMGAAFRDSPTALVGAFANGIVVVLLLNVFPYRAAAFGMGSSAIALSIGALYIGRIIFQYPLGKASDRLDRRIVILAASLLSAVLIFLITLLSPGDGSVFEGRAGLGPFAIAFVGFAIFGGCQLSLYSLLLSHAMDRTAPRNVASTAVTLLFVYSLGGVAGPIVAAVVSALFGDAAMEWMTFAIMLAFSGLAAIRIFWRVAVPKEEHVQHVPGATTSVEMVPTSRR